MTTIKKIFSGWEITVEEEHLFLTKAEDSTNSYVAIEHNLDCGDKLCCTPGCDVCVDPQVCCFGICISLAKCKECIE